jgi:hypothetical protein
LNDKSVKNVLFALEAVGTVFVGLFLAVYLGGLFATPQTTVFHSVPEIKFTLVVLGVVFLGIIFATLIIAASKRE